MGWKSSLLLLLLQQQLVRLSLATGTGFIRASNAHFVDENCEDFVATGLNVSSSP